MAASLRKLILFSLFLTVPFWMFSQGECSCTITESRIEAGMPFEIIYSSTRGEMDHIQLPNVPGLQFSARLGTSSSISIINGKQSARYEYTYQAVAQKEGRLVIPPATVTIEGRLVRCNGITITVEKPKNISVPSKGDDVFFKAALSQDKIYLGQQTILSFDIYTSKNVINAEFQKKPAYPHLFLKNIEAGRSGKTLTINKKQYYTQTIAAFQVFAQKSGIHNIPGANIIYKFEKATSSNPFFNEVESRVLTTNNLKLTVLELPENDVPASFSGGVGHFSVSCSLDKKTITLQEPVRLILTIKGDGDPKFWNAPTWEMEPGIERYDPNLLEETFSLENGREYTTRIYEYLFQPGEARMYTFIPEFSYFSPEDETYVTWKNEPIQVNVLAGGDTAPPLQDTLEEVSQNSGVDNNTWFNLNFLIPVLSCLILGLFIVLYFVKKKKASVLVLPPNQDKHKPEPEATEKIVSRALTLMEEGKIKEFYQEVLNVLSSRIILTFSLENKLRSQGEFQSILKENFVSPEMIDRFNHLYSSCELALFAGKKPDMNEIYHQSCIFLDFLEKNHQKS